MSDFQAFTAAELEGHRIGITCPGPSYDVLVHDLSSGLAISNVTSFVLTWDKQTCMIATLTLEGNTSVDVGVHHLHATSDLKSVQEEPVSTGGVIQPGNWAIVGGDSTGNELLFIPTGIQITPPVQEEQTTSTVPVPFPFSVSEGVSESMPDTLADIVSSGDTMSALPTVNPQIEQELDQQEQG